MKVIYQNEKPELDTQLLRPSGSTETWLISYSDLVTVLLCFFILFFVMKARQQEKDFLIQKNSFGKQELILSDVTKQLEASTLNARARISKFDRHISLAAKNVFFIPGKAKFSLEGEYFFTELALKIFHFIPSVQLQISLGVSEGQMNQQETLSRMMMIREYLNNIGISPEHISVGTHKQDDHLKQDVKDEIRVYITKNLRGSVE